MKKQTSLITLGLMLVTPALAGGGTAPAAKPATAACRSIAQIVMTDPNFSTLATAVEAAGLSQTLMSGQYTVFAPTNAAFAKLPSDALAAVLNDPEMLRSVLTYHVVAGKVTAKQVMGMKAGKTLNGANVSVMTSGNRVMVGGANVTRADVMACNGIIHVIDTVLMPPMAAAPAAAPVAAAPAPTTTTTTTTTAPLAFDITKIPATPLSGATTSTSTTTTTETATTETTTTETATTETTETTETTMASDTLYDVIVADERFSTLRDLLSDAELTETLTTGEFTIFAPTNEAFEALDQDQLALIASNPETLRQVLQYHVVQGRVTAEQISGNQALTTLHGGTLMPAQGINGQPLTASNGTIYVVNRVFLPQGLVIPTAPAGEATTTTTTTTTTPATTTTITITTSSQPIFASLVTNPLYTTLVDLLRTAGLEQMLSSGDYTILAPTNEAFGRIPAADLTALRADTARLRQVLLRHIIPSRVTATALSTVTELKTSQGATLTVQTSGTPAVTRIGDATVLMTGAVETTSGPIYSIDTVLMPR
ncbi:fasciclin domain-containing protein [Deinococcus deserti]|uniref:Putative Fasciclin domain protein n=1 Tax=Deinococcus deserti (strain DSM 17065 / CIP 109153 / LMG 22923 / VCD115) TaxID=546414 RepID=C1CW95_DEIDV|nr:fasciclin domain-containing protein [Deinococcus deserti]ACO46462.1 putative Fasciclin domain protein, precursor [Deinococcus deserti VCD115]